ncbi:MAG: DUF4258 domain-containing protein [Planctomycetes bacterium]|nr:DUF4258 domain-containing protein [Planctomycetota bacterium]
MNERKEILDLVRLAGKKKCLYLPHAIRQMSRPDRMITTDEVRSAIENGEIVEDYLKDLRGHSCLLLGKGKNKRMIHIVCSPKDEFLAVITAYIPDPNEWSKDYKVRVKK